MKLMNIALTSLVLLTGTVSASQLTNVTIQTLGYDRNYPNTLFIRTNIAPGGQDRIGCHSDNNWNFVLDLSTSFDEKIHSTLITAQANKQHLTLIGNGQCNVFNTIETLDVVYAN